MMLRCFGSQHGKARGLCGSRGRAGGALAVLSSRGAATLRRGAVAAALAGRRSLSLCGAVSGGPREGITGPALCRNLGQQCAPRQREGLLRGEREQRGEPGRNR